MLWYLFMIAAIALESALVSGSTSTNPAPMLFSKQAHDKPRSAVSALRTPAHRYRALCVSQLARGRQRFHRVDLAVGRHGQKHQTTVDDTVCAPRVVRLNQRHGAGSAFALRAALFGARQALLADEIQQRQLR